MSKFDALQLCNTDMEIKADGRWFHEGGEIKRKELVRLFASVLQRDEEGAYWLVTPVERAPIRVADAPFRAVELRSKGDDKDQLIELRTNVDDWVRLDTDHPLRIDLDPITLEPSPYIQVRQGLEAKLNRAVFYHLVDLAFEDDDQLKIWSAGIQHQLGKMS